MCFLCAVRIGVCVCVISILSDSQTTSVRNTELIVNIPAVFSWKV